MTNTSYPIYGHSGTFQYKHCNALGWKGKCQPVHSFHPFIESLCLIDGKSKTLTNKLNLNLECQSGTEERVSRDVSPPTGKAILENENRWWERRRWRRIWERERRGTVSFPVLSRGWRDHLHMSHPYLHSWVQQRGREDDIKVGRRNRSKRRRHRQRKMQRKIRLVWRESIQIDSQSNARMQSGNYCRLSSFNRPKLD